MHDDLDLSLCFSNQFNGRGSVVIVSVTENYAFQLRQVKLQGFDVVEQSAFDAPSVEKD
jgi:hypothetical protein